MKDCLIVLSTNPATGEVALAIRDDEDDTVGLALNKTQADSLILAIKEVSDAARAGVALTFVMSETVTPERVAEVTEAATAQLLARRGPLQ